MPAEVNLTSLGAKLRQVRLLRRLTQEAAAAKLGMARTTVVAIEAGKRPVSNEELRRFADIYDLDEGELLAQDEQVVELAIDFRTSAGGPGADDEALVASMLNRLASSTLQIEALLGQAPPKLDLPTISLPKTGSVETFAEDCAANVRSRLGIGVGPIQNLPALMEFDMGIRVFERRLPSKVAGAVAYHDKAGAFVLLNSAHPNSRRRVSAGHEAGHLLTRQPGVSVDFDRSGHQGRMEKFCDLFGIAFLAPAAAVRRKAKELKELSGGFSVRQLMMLSVFFNISIEAMTRRLEGLEMLPQGTFEKLRKQGIGLEHRQAVAHELSVTEESAPFTPRSLLLAASAYERELLSEQQIASMLEMNLIDVRRALEERPGHSGEVSLDLLE
jgi:Zn-dependent peptidase ImmA (M78 family)/transcriptional regulator with XRE-family HTH domain